MISYTELSSEQKARLENLVDETSITQILGTLYEICWEKAVHIKSNWQDTSLAEIWERAGNQLSDFYAKFSDRYGI